MKLKDLLEMPDLKDKEMSGGAGFGTINFYSADTIEREFDLIEHIENDTDEDKYLVILKKNKSFAVIGRYDIRKEDDKDGIRLIGQVEFKKHVDFAFDRLIDVSDKNVLQVDGVEIYDSKRYRGLGPLLYRALANYGYIIVSDHTHYLGGKRLWKKLGKTSGKDFGVYVVDNGHLLVDGDDNPIMYDAQNVSDDELWAPETTDIGKSKRYILFLLKKTR